MPKKLEGKIALVTGRNPLQKNTVYSSLTAFTWVRIPYGTSNATGTPPRGSTKIKGSLSANLIKAFAS